MGVGWDLMYISFSFSQDLREKVILMERSHHECEKLRQALTDSRSRERRLNKEVIQVRQTVWKYVLLPIDIVVAKLYALGIINFCCLHELQKDCYNENIWIYSILGNVFCTILCSAIAITILSLSALELCPCSFRNVFPIMARNWRSFVAGAACCRRGPRSSASWSRSSRNWKRQERVQESSRQALQLLPHLRLTPRYAIGTCLKHCHPLI